jgi:hypothetical protein
VSSFVLFISIRFFLLPLPLLTHIEAGQVDVVVVYKVDRLTRALSDFAKLVEVFDRRGVSFVSITQQFNTTTSMGRRHRHTGLAGRSSPHVSVTG